MLPPLTLITTTADRLAPPPLPDGCGTDVTPWRDPRGRLGAVSHAVDGEPWLHVLDVASFHLDLAHDRVVAVASPNALPGAIEDEFRRTVRPVALQLRGWEVLHASAVRTGSGVVALCAASETGKSTLAYALARGGHPLWADAAVVLDVAADGVWCLPLAFDVRLRAASARHFGHEVDPISRGRYVRPAETATAPCPLRAICLLDRRDDAEPLVRIDRIDGSSAVADLLAHAIYFGFGDRDRKRRMIGRYLALASRVPVHRVVYRSGLERLPAVADELARALALGTPA